MHDWLLIIESMLIPLVPLFFQGACPCCGVACGTAGLCSSTPATITTTYTGYSNNTCTSCANYNATWISSRDTGIVNYPANCVYISSLVNKGCATGGNADGSNVFFLASGSDTVLRVQNFINSPGATRDNRLWEINLGASPIACKDYGPVSVPFSTATNLGICTHDGSDVEVVVS